MPPLSSILVFALPAKRKRVALAAYFLLTTLLIFITFSRWGNDDSYITYRYAANLQQGLGFVYNPCERVLSTTTPLFTLLLALLGNLSLDLPFAANLLGAFSLALGGFFLWDLAHTWEAPAVGWSGLLLYPTFPLLVSTLSSETLLYLALCLGAFAFYARRGYPWTAVCAALAVLTRPDGILVVFVLAVHYLIWIRRPIPWLSLAIFLGLTLPWFAFAWMYFGSPLPVTLAVKQHQGAMAISQRFAPGLLTIIRPYAKWSYFLEAGLSLVGLVWVSRRGHPWALFLTWTGLYYLAYSALGVSRYFWYYAPLVPGLIVLLGLGINYLKNFFSSNQTYSFPIFTAVLFLLLASAQISDLWDLRQHPDNRLVIYTRIGQWLQEHTPPQASVGTLEVGVIGFHAQRRMIDFSGLIQPEVSDQFSLLSTYEDTAIWAVEQYHPDYIVIPRNSYPRLEQGYIITYCKVIQSFPGQVDGYPSDMDVYECK